MENAIMVAGALIGAGLCFGLAAIGAGIGDGLVTGRLHVSRRRAASSLRVR